MSKNIFAAVLAGAFATLASAQGAPGGTQQAVTGPEAGTVAPDFTAPGADKSGVLKAPIKLSDFKGKTVVLAFFPAARTSGCTMQMTHYRDEYEKLFMGGKDVVLLGVSTDADTTLANWAKEANFPFKFVSDAGRSIGLAYGTLDENRKTMKRYLYVIGPDGKITYTKKSFAPASQAHYDEMAEAIHNATPHSHK